VDFTLAAWAYLDTKGISRTVISKWDSAGNNREYLLSYNWEDNRFKLTVSNNGTATTSLKADSLGSPAVYTWYFIVAWHDSVNNTLNIQVDNGPVDSVAYTSGVFGSSAEFRLGASDNSMPLYWNGRIDGAGFWRRVLTSTERSALWNAGLGCDYPFTSCPNTGTATPTPTPTVTQTPTVTPTPGTLPSGETWKLYYVANGKPVAMRVVDNSTNKLYFLHGDHLGSTSLTTCGNAACGTIGAEYSRQFYLPYGSLRATSGSATPTDIGFTGQRLDATGLMFYNARYYSPTLGRFISADTMVPGAGNPQAFNRYAYTLNNPLNYIDPTGHCPLCLTAIIGGAIGAIAGAVAYTGYVVATGQQFNAGHMFLAAGGGLAAGALIGTGIGFAAGLTVAEATVAATTAGTVATAANTACGGDLCASEAQDAVQLANAACGGDMCASEAQGAAQLLNEAAPVAEEATEQITTVIGNHPANQELAESIGANWHNVPMETWNSLTEYEQWEVNRQWLQEAINRGDVIRLATKLSEARADSVYLDEIDQLFDTGYTISQDGNYLLPPIQ
jgi:RHS repeat-associated protein